MIGYLVPFPTSGDCASLARRGAVPNIRAITKMIRINTPSTAVLMAIWTHQQVELWRIDGIDV